MGNPMCFAPNVTTLHVNDVTSAKFIIKGAMGIFLDTQQCFRPDSLTAYVTIAFQVIKHFVSHFKLK